jgi:hypothetical protein
MIGSGSEHINSVLFSAIIGFDLWIDVLTHPVDEDSAGFSVLLGVGSCPADIPPLCELAEIINHQQLTEQHLP